jgi:hypothetical protein
MINTIANARTMFRNSMVGEVVSFITLSGEVVSGKILTKESKRGRNGGTTFSIETVNGVRSLTTRDCFATEPK